MAERLGGQLLVRAIAPIRADSPQRRTSAERRRTRRPFNSTLFVRLFGRARRHVWRRFARGLRRIAFRDTGPNDVVDEVTDQERHCDSQCLVRIHDAHGNNRKNQKCPLQRMCVMKVEAAERLANRLPNRLFDLGRFDGLAVGWRRLPISAGGVLDFSRRCGGDRWRSRLRDRRQFNVLRLRRGTAAWKQRYQFVNALQTQVRIFRQSPLDDPAVRLRQERPN